jgi:hypothetical protein
VKSKNKGESFSAAYDRRVGGMDEVKRFSGNVKVVNRIHIVQTFLLKKRSGFIRFGCGAN